MNAFGIVLKSGLRRVAAAVLAPAERLALWSLARNADRVRAHLALPSARDREEQTLVLDGLLREVVRLQSQVDQLRQELAERGAEQARAGWAPRSLAS